jgi:RNA polymerase sigma-70 factor (ECF subfamily)
VHPTEKDSPSQSATQLLNAWSAGDETAGKELMEIIYQELRRLAAHYLQNERPDHTLQPTALVNELYIKLFSSEPVRWQNRGHFLAVAARQLRHLVIDYARVQRAQKRGGGQARLSLDGVAEAGIVMDDRILDLDRALDRLSKLDERAAKVVELRYFGALTENEVAEALGISVPTVKRDWEFARSWLLNEID